MPFEQIDRNIAVSAPPSQVWAAITDVPNLLDWVPILQDVRIIAPLERYEAVLADRLGPFSLKADLEITVSDVDEPRSLRVVASGEDRQVASRIGIDVTLRIDGSDPCTLSATGTYEVSGRVATLGASAIRKKANKILEAFMTRASQVGM